MLKIVNLKKNYNKIIALDELNFSLNPGEVYGLLGPNGAGKSTTLKILSGLISADSGTITLNNTLYNRDDKNLKKQIAYVPDEPYLYSKLTGEEHMHFYADLYGLPKDVREEKIDFFFRYFEFSWYRNKLTENYSSGTKQKLLLSQALMVNPKILLLDEPLMSIDPLVSKKCKQYLKKTSSNGTIILFATHILSLALEVSNRIGIIVNGKIINEIKSSELSDLKSSEELENYYYKIVTQYENTL